MTNACGISKRYPTMPMADGPQRMMKTVIQTAIRLLWIMSAFEQAKRCYEKAGLETAWLELVEDVRERHSRKYGFMPGFEHVS